jgi:hypothetical protein
MKISDISSSAPQFRGCRHNIIFLNMAPENETERALMRTLAAHVGHVNVYSDGTLSIQFKPTRRKHS